MAATTEVLIGDAAGERVLLTVLARNHPGLFDYRDGNSVACEVEICAGGFRGAFRADLRSDEFQAFLDETEAMSGAPDGVATFATVEEQVRFVLAGDGADHVRVSGEAVDVPGSANRLHFSFEIDRSQLTEVCKSLEVILAAFPVLGSADA